MINNREMQWRCKHGPVLKECVKDSVSGREGGVFEELFYCAIQPTNSAPQDVWVGAGILVDSSVTRRPSEKFGRLHVLTKKNNHNKLGIINFLRFLMMKNIQMYHGITKISFYSVWYSNWTENSGIYQWSRPWDALVRKGRVEYGKVELTIISAQLQNYFDIIP